MNSRLMAIQQKLLKANSVLSEIDVLVAHHYYATAINRLYYACFHATKALLLTKNLIPKTHSGVINLLHQHFVQSGLMDVRHAAFFSRLLQERIEDDYSDVSILNEDEVILFIQPAKEYVKYIEELIKSFSSERESC